MAGTVFLREIWACALLLLRRLVSLNEPNRTIIISPTKSYRPFIYFIQLVPAAPSQQILRVAQIDALGQGIRHLGKCSRPWNTCDLPEPSRSQYEIQGQEEDARCREDVGEDVDTEELWRGGKEEQRGGSKCVYVRYIR